jgi:hypothetical protein
VTRKKHDRGTLAWLLAGALALTGCSSYSGSTAFLNEAVTPGRETSYLDVQVFASRDIGIEYVELGSVCAAVNAEVQGSQYLNLIRKEAARIGADAVVSYEQWGTTATGIAVRYVKRPSR